MKNFTNAPFVPSVLAVTASEEIVTAHELEDTIDKPLKDLLNAAQQKETLSETPSETTPKCGP